MTEWGITPAKLEIPISRMPPGWNNSYKEWVLPDWGYSKERFEEVWAMYQKLLDFEKENQFMEQTSMFLSDYPELFAKYFAKEDNTTVKNEKMDEVKEVEDKIIPLTRPIDFDDLNYFMDHYDYDPDDDVVNNYDDTQAENFIRSKIIEYRKSIGKQI